MAKIQRVTGKVFGGTATATGADPQIGQFGSALAGTYLGTTDISTIQQLPAWGQGFIGAVTTDNQFPALPEVTGFGKVLSQQQCYILQQGVAEWDSGTTYYTGSFCSKGGLLYVSTIDENLNNDPESDFLNWSLYAGGTSAYIGQTVFSLLPIVDAGVHLLDGTLLNGDGIYSGFVDYIKTLDLTASYFTTEADWQASVSQYGVCGKFVYDSVNNTVRLPKVTGIVEGTIDANALGDLVQAGLPTHTHTRGTMNITGNIFIDGQDTAFTSYGTGAFFTNGTFKAKGNGHGDHYNEIIGFDASRSWTGATSTGNYSSNIQSTDTVQPQTIKGYYYIVVATSTKTDIEVDIDNVVTDLNGKADVDFSNVNSTGTSLASGWSMPSSNYIDLTLGASGSAIGTTYTAPANGWFHLANNSGAGNPIALTNLTASLGISTPNGVSGITGSQISIPAKKNDIVRAVHVAPSGSTTTLRFIYAEGEEA